MRSSGAFSSCLELLLAAGAPASTRSFSLLAATSAASVRHIS